MYSANKAKCKGTSLPGSTCTPAGRPAEQARLAARSGSATACWIPGGDRVSTYHKSRGGQGEHGHRGDRVGCGSASHAFYSRERETDQLKNADAEGKIGVSADARVHTAPPCDASSLSGGPAWLRCGAAARLDRAMAAAAPAAAAARRRQMLPWATQLVVVVLVPTP
jgi:hypothetical protein